jgi:hypothetical protein
MIALHQLIVDALPALLDWPVKINFAEMQTVPFRLT